jgi:uncharacterized coiled-coil DUF342 family protein
MPSRDAYVEMLKLKLDEWNNRIETLQVLMKLAKQEARDEAKEHVGRLRTKRDELRSKIKDYQEAGEEAKTAVKLGIEKVHADMQDTLDEVKSSLTR